MIFAEAITAPEDYKTFTSNVAVPVLANMTEFGKSPLMNVKELGKVGIQLVLYPLSAFRAMNLAAEKVFHEIRNQGTQSAVVEQMQTRQELYDLLGYYEVEQRIDRMFKTSKQGNKDE